MAEGYSFMDGRLDNPNNYESDGIGNHSVKDIVNSNRDKNFNSVQFRILDHNNQPFTDKPYVMAFGGPNAQGSVYNSGVVTDSNNDVRDLVNNPNWHQVMRDLTQRILDRAAQSHNVEVHTSLGDGTGLVAAMAAANAKYALKSQGSSDTVKLVASSPYLRTHYPQGDTSERLFQQLLGTGKFKSQGPLVDALVVYDGQDSGTFNSGDPVFEKERQGRVMGADEAVVVAPDNYFSQNDRSATTSFVNAARRATGKVSQVALPKMSYVPAQSRRHQQASQNNNGVSSDFDQLEGQYRGQNPQPTASTKQGPAEDNANYVMLASSKPHVTKFADVVLQDRYDWRSSNVSADSPVSSDELLEALSPAITQNSNRRALKDFLMSPTMSTLGDINYLGKNTTGNGSKAEGSMRIVSVKGADGKYYNLSPSDVQTMMTVLSAVHDSGLNYKFGCDTRSNSIYLQLNDNARTQITLIDPQEPQRVGQVRSMQNNIYWTPEMTRMRYVQVDKNNKPTGPMTAMAVGITDDHGKHVEQDPVKKAKYSVVYRYSERELSRLGKVGQNPRYQVNADLSQQVARGRYEGLDQRTKNKLALGNLVNVLGIDPTTLSNQMQDEAKVGQVKSMDVLSSKGLFQAQLDLNGKDAIEVPNAHGKFAGVPAQINRVNFVDSDGNVSQLDDKLVKPGRILLDMSAASVGDQRPDIAAVHASQAIRLNPGAVNSHDANSKIVEAYAEARRNWIGQVTGPDRSNDNELLGKVQRQFKRALSDTFGQETLDSTGLNTDREQLQEPLDANSQKVVLENFVHGVELAGIENNDDHFTVNDTPLMTARHRVEQSVADENNQLKKQSKTDLSVKPLTDAQVQILTDRRLNAFDNLTKLMDAQFGTAPVVNHPGKITGRQFDASMTLDDYKENLKQSLNGRLSHDQAHDKLGQFDRLVHEYRTQVENISDDGRVKKLLDQTLDNNTFESQQELAKTWQYSDDPNTKQAGKDLQDIQNEFTTALSNNQLTIDPQLNITNVITYTENRANSIDYEYNMARLVANSDYKDVLAGNNDYDSEAVMEHSVQFDPKSAQTIEELRAADQDPKSKEYQLQQYIKDVKSGKKQFTFDPKVNPMPGAFKSDGSGLINPVSPNEYKARVLETIKGRLEAHGVNPKFLKLGIDKNGVIKFDAQVPLYDEVVADNKHPFVATRYNRHFGGRVKNSYKFTAPNGEALRGSNFAYKHVDDDPSKPRVGDSNGWPVYDTDDQGRVKITAEHRDANGKISGFGKMRMQHISGTFGQIFAPDHDGLIRTRFNRFNQYDQSAGQKTILPRYRATYQLLDVDSKGNWDKGQLERENADGLGVNHRLRAFGYNQLVHREVAQATDMMLANRNVGDVSMPTSNTILNKLYRGEALGDTAPEALLNEKPSAVRQAKLETAQRAARFTDDVREGTTVSAVITFMQQYQNVRGKMKADAVKAYRQDSGNQTAKSHAQDPDWPSKYDVMTELKSPLSVYGNASIGEIAKPENWYIFSQQMTGQGKMFGTLRFFNNGVQVLPNGVVKPVLARDKNGNPIHDKEGHVVGVDTGTPIENLPMFDGANKDSADRDPVGKEQAMKGNAIIKNAHVASMALGAWPMEDGMVVSKKFAENHKFTDTNGDYRAIKIGDKISDGAGNKATVSAIIDPDMDPKKAEDNGMLDIVRLFHDNPDLDVVMNGMSQLSRNNGSDPYAFVNNKSSKPMKFTRLVDDGQGNLVKGPEVQTNATINQGYLVITDQTVEHKVTTYDNDPEGSGRKSGALGANSDISKGAFKVANYFRKYKNGMLSWRQHLLSMGLDYSPKGLSRINFDKLVKDENQPLVSYKISDDTFKQLDSVYQSHQKGIKGQDSLMRPVVINHQAMFLAAPTLKRIHDAENGKTNKLAIFDGLDKNGNLTDGSKKFLNTVISRVRKNGIAVNDNLSSSDNYNAGADFLRQLPDGGVLQLPEGLSLRVKMGNPKTAQQDSVDKMYILPEHLRNNTRMLNGTMAKSQFNQLYGKLGVRLAQYQVLHREFFDKNKLATNSDQKKAIEGYLQNQLGIQGIYDRIENEASKVAFGNPKPKNSEFDTDVLAGRVKDSVTTQVSSNPNLPLDVIEVSPKIAKSLGFVNGKDGYAHMKGHDDWTMLHVHRDPIWREQGSLAFRVKINPELANVRISPVVASLMDGDFDGDNLGLIAMKGDDVQRELKDKVSVDHWLLDNNGVNDFNNSHTLLNINAEIIDMANRTNQTYDIKGVDGKTRSYKLFDHAKDKDGNQVALKDDPKLQNTLIDFVSHIRPDLRPKDATSDDGRKITWQDQIKDGLITDSDVLNMAVDNVIKNSYQQKADNQVQKNQNAKDARLGVEKLVQTARGFDVSQGKDGELKLKPGKVSVLENDGVDYTNLDTMTKSLTKYVNEGAKGSPEALSGLLDYMNQPLFSQVKALGIQQIKNGKLDPKAHAKYVKTMMDLTNRIVAVQKSTKEKSDATGIPGTIQKDITAVLLGYGPKGMHAANAIGQPGTQKVLSIKRDPLKAAQVAEILQGPINSLLQGRRPTQYPLFALVGDPAQGRLGNDLLDVSDKIPKLKILATSYIHKGTDDEVVKVAKGIGLKVPQDRDAYNKFMNGFKQTICDAMTPYVPNQVRDASGKTVQLLHTPTSKHDFKITKQDFVNSMNYLYNDVMGLSVDKKNFEALGTVLENGKGGYIRSVKDAVKDVDIVKIAKHQQGFAPMLSKIKQQGLPAANAEIAKQDQGEKSNPIFGKEGSEIRKEFADGMTDEEFNQVLDLNQRENPLSDRKSYQDSHDLQKTESEIEQDQLIQSVHDKLGKLGEGWQEHSQDSISEKNNEFDSIMSSLNQSEQASQKALDNMQTSVPKTASQAPKTSGQTVADALKNPATSKSNAESTPVENAQSAASQVKNTQTAEDQLKSSNMSAIDRTIIGGSYTQAPFNVPFGKQEMQVNSVNQYVLLKQFAKGSSQGMFKGVDSDIQKKLLNSITNVKSGNDFLKVESTMKNLSNNSDELFKSGDVMQLRQEGLMQQMQTTDNPAHVKAAMKKFVETPTENPMQVAMQIKLKRFLREQANNNVQTAGVQDTLSK